MHLSAPLHQADTQICRENMFITFLCTNSLTRSTILFTDFLLRFQKKKRIRKITNAKKEKEKLKFYHFWLTRTYLNLHFVLFFLGTFPFIQF